MKKLTLLSGYLFCILSALTAQNYSFTPKRITQHEASMTEYEKDPDAEAIVIYELGDYYFQTDYDQGFLLTKNIKTKIKILKQSGIEYADFEIPIYKESLRGESLDIKSAVVYNMDGDVSKKTEFDKKNIFEENLGNNWYMKKFTLPDVKEGSVIEVDYTIVSPYLFTMGTWSFQKKIPVIHSQLKYRAIPYYQYAYIVKGITKFDDFKSEVLPFEKQFRNLIYQEVEYIFVMNSLPAFRDEVFITSPKDYIISMNFQLAEMIYSNGSKKRIMSTWPQLCDDLIQYPEFGKYINSSEKEGKKLLATFPLTDDKEDNLKLITKYVKSAYNWNGRYGKYATGKLSDFLKNKTGSDADINLFLIGLLKAAKFDVTPVILSTRKNGIISKEHPFESFFNYVIALVTIDDKHFFIDATEPLLYFNELPERCLNMEGLLVKPKSEEWVLILQNDVALNEKSFNLKINENEINITSRYTSSGVEAYTYRSEYLGKEENLVDYLKKEEKITAADINVENTLELEKPFSFTFSFSSPLEKNAEKLFVHPFCHLSLKDNPLKQPTRTYPLDMTYQKTTKYKSVIEIPDGYKVEYVPKSRNVDNKMLLFTYSVKENGNTIEIESEFAPKKIIYTADEYGTFKNLISVVIKQLEEIIILSPAEKEEN